MVLFGTFGLSEDSKRGLLGACLGRPRGILGALGALLERLWGILVASLRRPGLGNHILGLDLAKLG